MLSLLNCYNRTYRRIATVSAINIIIYLFIYLLCIFVILFWFLGYFNGQHLTNLVILLCNEVANNFLLSFLVDHTVTYLYS